jgi:pyruvate ferredoxin oxidoreductase gamma subunit
VLDVSLLSEKDIVAGIPSGGWLIVNTSMNQLAIQDVVKRNDINIATIDATRIALDILGRNITNTIILGALVRVSYLFSLEELSDAIMARFKGEVAVKNINAVKQAIEETCAYECGIDVDFSFYNKLLWSQVELHLPGYKDLDKAGVWYLDVDKNLIRVGSDQVNTGVWGEYDIIWDPQVCTNCSQCWFICPDFAIMRNLGEDGQWHMIGIDAYHCKSCQNCVNICPVQAISKKPRQEPFSCAAPP